MGGPNDTKEEHAGDQPKQGQTEHRDGGNTGHGADSAMAHMISQGRQHRHHAGEADDAAGASGQ